MADLCARLAPAGSSEPLFAELVAAGLWKERKRLFVPSDLNLAELEQIARTFPPDPMPRLAPEKGSGS